MKHPRHALPPLLLILAVCAAAAPPEADAEGEDEGPPTEEVVIRGETFRLEIAADAEARARGLAERDEIAAHGGMIFIWRDERRRSFWMKDCLVDIDVLFLDREGRIVARHEMKAEPLRRRFEGELAYERRLERYPSRRPAQFAVELKAGTIKRLKLKKLRAIELERERLVELIPDDDPDDPGDPGS